MGMPCDNCIQKCHISQQNPVSLCASEQWVPNSRCKMKFSEPSNGLAPSLVPMRCNFSTNRKRAVRRRVTLPCIAVNFVECSRVLSRVFVSGFPDYTIK